MTGSERSVIAQALWGYRRLGWRLDAVDDTWAWGREVRMFWVRSPHGEGPVVMRRLVAPARRHR